MLRKKQQLKSKLDDYPIYFTSFIPEKIDHVMLLIHGMQDYSLRYECLVPSFMKNNICLVLVDLRGHGQNEFTGHFADQDGYLYQIEDLKQLIIYLKKSYHQNISLLGHSMGSLFTLALLDQIPLVLDKVILSGLPSPNPLTKPLSKVISKMPKVLRKVKSKKMHQQFLYQFNKSIKNPRTTHDWLSFNENNVDYYIQSDKVGFRFSNQAYLDLFNLLSLVYQDKPRLSSSYPLEILVLIGEHDPVVNLKKLEKKMKEFDSVTLISYENSRHELFFDQDKEKVINDVLNFINS